MIIKIVTLGCKVNACESASIMSALISENYNASEGLAPADAYVLNTCSVTAEADRKSRQYITKMIKLNPDCKIIVVGCSSQNSPNKFDKPNVVAIGGTKNKISFVKNALNTIYCSYNTLSDRILYDKNLAPDICGCRDYEYGDYPCSNKTRAFIKVQDGCDRFCTYCIIPYLRGRSRSRNIDDIVNECKQCVSHEIVITGIDLSAYGKDLGISLKDLLRSLSEFEARKRLGSLECEIVDRELLEIMKIGGYCPHFHLSLQSGDDFVLKSMNRRYDTAYYYDKIRLIRDFFPNAGITTDVIVGFPTETPERFDNACEFIKKCEFSDIHVFPYSGRTGTLAHKKYAPLKKSVLDERMTVMIGIKNDAKQNFIDKNIGTVASVYVEDYENGYNVGYTPNYIRVYSDSSRGEIIKLKLNKPIFDGILGVKS